jgi:hypothetical protein
VNFQVFRWVGFPYWKLRANDDQCWLTGNNQLRSQRFGTTHAMIL